MSKKYTDIEIEINDIEFPNKGIGTFNGKKTVIKNTISGQKVIADIKKKKGQYEGYLKKTVKKADYETEPLCPAFGLCGGCTYQNIEYEKELEIKKKTVLDLLEKSGISGFEFMGIKGSPDTEGYRNKMEFSFGDNGAEGKLCLGMRKRNSYYEVVNADICRIVHEDIRKILSTVLEFFRNSKESFYHKTRHTGSLRHLLVRRGHFSEEILIGLVTTSDIKTDLTPLIDDLLSIELKGKIKGISHIINDGVADTVKADKVIKLYGEDHFTERLLGLNFKISTFSFFQTNSAGAEVLYSTVRDFVENKNNNVIFDLYCGTGTITQLMSCNAKKAVGIEIVEEAVKAAEINAELNGISNCKFIAGDVLDMVDKLEDEPDLIILDPPRDGIHPKAISKIIDFNAPRLVYISCKASSLSKDLKIFEENGYKVEKICCVDMFPRTYHVETVVLLSQQRACDYIDIDIELNELDTTKSEKHPTYEQIKGYVLKNFGLKVSSLYISQVKKQCGIDVAQAYNKPKSDNPRVPNCPPEKKEAIIKALKYYNVI